MTREDLDFEFKTAETLMNDAIDRLKVAFGVSRNAKDAAGELARCQVCLDLATSTVVKLRRSFGGL